MKILSKWGLYMESLNVLNAGALGEYTDGQIHNPDVIEKNTTHFLKGNRHRSDCRRLFDYSDGIYSLVYGMAASGSGPGVTGSTGAGERYNVAAGNNAHRAICIEPRAREAQILASYTDYRQNEISPCGMGIFENRLGGRVCVSGYYPFTMIDSLPKAAQIKNVFLWLSKKCLPAYIASFHKMAVWARRTRAGGPGALIANLSLDEAENARLALLSKPGTDVVLVNAKAQQTILSPETRDGDYNFYVLPQIGALEVCFIAVW